MRCRPGPAWTTIRYCSCVFEPHLCRNPYGRSALGRDRLYRRSRSRPSALLRHRDRCRQNETWGRTCALPHACTALSVGAAMAAPTKPAYAASAPFAFSDSAVKPVASCTAMSASTLRPRRSEEHTSELQSLEHLSYAVLCYHEKRKTKTC